MPKKEDARTVMRKKTGKKDVARILNKIDKMLKQGVDRNKIEKALALELSAHLRAQLNVVVEESNPYHVYR